MSQPTGEGQQSGPDSGQQSGQGSEGDSLNNQHKPNETSGSETEGQQSGQTESDETKSLRERMANADRRAQAAETKLRELERAKLDETERTKLELKDAQEKLAELEKANADLRISQSFLEIGTYKWHSPETALRLLDRSRVTVDSDGKINGMKPAVDALAKEHPYLLQPEEPKDRPPAGPTGIPMGGGSTTGKPTTNGMESRIPALRTRRAPG